MRGVTQADIDAINDGLEGWGIEPIGAVKPAASFVLPGALAPLTKLRIWVVWRWEKTKDGKVTKVPYQPSAPKYHAKSDDAKTWSYFKTALSVLDRFDGIGLMLRDCDFVAFDIDDCRDKETGVIDPWALNLVEKAGSYTEITPSNTGLRIIGRGTGPKIHRKQPAVNGVSLETFRKAERFITVTGNMLPGCKTELANLDALMDATVAELDGGVARKGNGADRTDTFKDAKLEDIAPDDPRLSGLAAKWIALGHDGEGMEKYGGHRSRAVMAFCCECFRAGVAENVLRSCLMHWPIGQHIRDQSNVERALNRAVSRAHEFVTDSKLFEMNEQHCVLSIGGKTRVATWDEDPDFPGRQTIVSFSSFGDWKALHNKYRHSFPGTDAKGNPTTVTMGLGDWWISQPHRRQYDGGMRFMPSRDEDVVGNTLNLWQGFAVADRKPEGKSGEAGCKLFLDHGLKIICNGDEARYAYMMKREALIAQKRIRSEIAAGFRTEVEGTGKGFWERVLNHLYGPHAMEVQNANHIVGRHNKHLEVLLRLTADEALFAGDPRHRNALYNLVTEPHLTIEPKFVDAYPANNFLNIDIISNAAHFLTVSSTARRFFVPTVSVERANDHEYFRKIAVQMEDEGGYEALLYHLLHEIDMRDFNVRAVPKTAALAEQATHSRKGVDLLVEKACSEAAAPCQHQDYPGFSICTDADKQKGFDHFIDHHSDRDLRFMGALGVKRRLAIEWNCITGKAARRTIDYTRVNGVIWPDLARLRTMFQARHRDQQWLCPDATDWLDVGWSAGSSFQ